jgi:hypothetical protein
MSKVLNLKKNLVNTSSLSKVVNTEFSTFTQVDTTETVISVEEFFIQYENLFFEIPPSGEKNSHEYLAKTSGEYINYQKDTQDIQPLLDEIASLRNQLLEVNKQLVQPRS